MDFDHLGVVCRDMHEARLFLSGSLAVGHWTAIFSDPIQKVHVQFGRDTSGTVYELIEPISEDSPVSATLRAGKNILNHVAYRTPDLTVAAEKLAAEGCLPVTVPNPALAFGGARIQFFFSPLGFVIELIELDRDIHVFDQVS